jgi:hypothetical protein
VRFVALDIEYHENNHEGAAMVRHTRLTLGLFFLIAGVALLVLRFGAPEVAARINSPLRLVIGALLALALGGVNVAKWYAGWLAYNQRATPIRRPLQPDPTASAETDPNPEFDFGKNDERSAQ